MRDANSLGLSITRDERIFIGEGDDVVIISLTKISGGQAALSFEAPRTTPINRERIYLRKKANGELK